MLLWLDDDDRTTKIVILIIVFIARRELIVRLWKARAIGSAVAIASFLHALAQLDDVNRLSKQRLVNKSSWFMLCNQVASSKCCN